MNNLINSRTLILTARERWIDVTDDVLGDIVVVPEEEAERWCKQLYTDQLNEGMAFGL